MERVGLNVNVVTNTIVSAKAGSCFEEAASVMNTFEEMRNININGFNTTEGMSGTAGATAQGRLAVMQTMGADSAVHGVKAMAGNHVMEAADVMLNAAEFPSVAGEIGSATQGGRPSIGATK